MPDPVRLVILPFLQSWDGSRLTFRLVLIPRGNPLSPLIIASPLPTPNPSFAEANFNFDVSILPADILPSPATTPIQKSTIASSAVSSARDLYSACLAQLPIDPSPPEPVVRLTGARVKKYLPLTYQITAGYGPGRSTNVVTDCSYLCLFKSPPLGRLPKKIPPVDTIPWGKVIALLLRNVDLSHAAGLIREFTVPITDPGVIKYGAYLYVSLNTATGDGGTLDSTGGLKYYATKIPSLQISNRPDPRSIFSPVLFPVRVGPAPAGTDYSTVFEEIDTYSDGWAKIVHAYQPQQLSYLDETPNGSRPAKEMGIRLGWDDEQVTDWMHRQITDEPAVTGLDAPLGVMGYRIDASIHGSGMWSSLCQAKGPIQFTVPPTQFSGELNIEMHPANQDAENTADFWLPQYFCSWHGPSLVGVDLDLVALSGGPTDPDPDRIAGVDPTVSLRYGTKYDFRVRLVDLAFGGPPPTNAPVTPRIPGISPVGSILFKRWIRPSYLNWVNQPSATSSGQITEIQLQRPLLEYPAVACTGKYNNVMTLLRNDIPLAIAQKREAGLYDPDVTQVQIAVMVKGLAQDPATDSSGYISVYVAKRDFPSDFADTLNIPIVFTDIANVSDLADGGEALQLPTARFVKLLCVPVCLDDSNYMGAQDVRFGPARVINLRQAAATEKLLYVGGDTPFTDIKAVFCQPDSSNTAKPKLLLPIGAVPSLFNPQLTSVPDIGSRLANAFGLRNNNLSLRAPVGRRVVFGCSDALRHALGPDGASITFPSQSNLSLHWVVAIKWKLNRDWSWDGVAFNGVTVTRDGEEIGSFSPTRNVSTDALNPLPGQSIDRTTTDLIFFDAIDPKPAQGSFPKTLNPSYSISCILLGDPPPTAPVPITLSLKLPITTPPAQIPAIASAGIALSPFTPAPDYSSTSSREKRLWIEFTEPIADPQDQYFSRVLRNSPDPLISSSGLFLSESDESPLPIDPEFARIIVPDQSDDRAGLDAMQRLIPASDSARHFSLPLPPGMDANSAELFGFFTYEIRVGHYGVAPDLGASWSTAQGRYGRPLRVTGVQHPPPPLIPNVQRDQSSIHVSVPFAGAILNGISSQPARPLSTIWIMLYAQVAQLDNGLALTDTTATINQPTTSPLQLKSQFRNVLLGVYPAIDPSNPDTTNGKPRQRVRGLNAYAEADILTSTVTTLLESLALHDEAPLSVLAVEMLPQRFQPVSDPMGADLGRARVLRTSDLVKVNPVC